MDGTHYNQIDLTFQVREQTRREEFTPIWQDTLDAVFADVAPYYDFASDVASLGLCSRWRRRFSTSVEVRPGDRVLDVCAGTNGVGIELLKRQPDLNVSAIDRSAAMQEEGGRRARARGFEIESHIGDVHILPFPDASFDVVTLPFASRHLRALLRSGCTAVGEIDSTGCSPAALRSVPVAGRCYRELLGFDLGPRQAAALVRERSSAGRVAGCPPGLSPHAPYSVSAALFRAARRTAASLPRSSGNSRLYSPHSCTNFASSATPYLPQVTASAGGQEESDPSVTGAVVSWMS